MTGLKSFGAIVTLLIGLFWLGCDYVVTRNGAGPPTTIGLGALGLLFVVLSLLRLVKLTSPASGTRRSHSATDEAPRSDFDADAAIRNYLDRKARGEIVEPPPADIPPPPPPRGFGRKQR